MKPFPLLKHLPASARILIRPTLLFSLVLHGIVLMLPISSDLDKFEPPKKEARIKITQLPKTQPSPKSSPRTFPKSTPQSIRPVRQPTVTQRPSIFQQSDSLTEPQSKPKRISETPQLSKPSPEPSQNSNPEPTPQPSKPNPEPTPQPSKPNPEPSQNSNPEPTPQTSKPNPKPSPSPDSQETQAGLGDENSQQLRDFMSQLKPSNYLLFALTNLKNLIENEEKSAKLEKCEKNDNVFNCRLKTDSSADKVVFHLQKALENQEFQGFSKVESYRGTGTLYKAQKDDFTSYFLITTDSDGQIIVALLDKEP
ncbi:MAG TPA: hypothetical protein V6D33_04170 [Cyanophyceae cyanobacterium]